MSESPRSRCSTCIMVFFSIRRTAESEKALAKPHAQRLAGEATLAEEVALIQNTDGCFLSIVRHDRELDLTVL